MEKGKSFEISKKEVMEAFKLVKANHGAGGVDGIDIEKYEESLKDNLYKLWNRMSSGSYSCQIPTDTDLINRHLTQLAKHENDVGRCRGYWSSISKDSSTT